MVEMEDGGRRGCWQDLDGAATKFRDGTVLSNTVGLGLHRWGRASELCGIQGRRCATGLGAAHSSAIPMSDAQRVVTTSHPRPRPPECSTRTTPVYLLMFLA